MPGQRIGIHVNIAGTAPADISRALQSGEPPPIVDRTREIEFFDAGLEAFALTFG